jgi:hypothetical protein
MTETAEEIARRQGCRITPTGWQPLNPDAPNPNGQNPTGWQLEDLAPILAGTTAEKPPSMLLRIDEQGLIYPGKTHSIAGEPEAGKGWLALQLCAERMAASFSEHAVYLDFEDTASSAVDRLRAIGVPDETIGERFHYVSPTDPLEGAIVDLLPQGTTVAVIDGVTEAMTLHGLDLRDNTDVAKFLGMVPRPLARKGLAVVLLDHVAKDREARGRGGIGAQAKLAGVDVSYMLDIVTPFGKGLTGLSRLTVMKDRPGFIRATSASRKLAADVEIVSEDNDVVVVVKPVEFETDPLGLKPAERRVLDALPNGPPGAFTRDIGDRVVEQGWEAGLARETIQRALRVLNREGLADGADSRWWRIQVTPSPIGAGV